MSKPPKGSETKVSVSRQAYLEELNKSHRAQAALQLLGLPDMSSPQFDKEVGGLVAFLARNDYPMR